MARNWESSPWKWVAVVVLATVIGGVTTAAIQKWWGLKLQLQQQNLGVPAQAYTGTQTGKYIVRNA